MVRIGNEPDYVTSHERRYESHTIVRHFENREEYWEAKILHIPFYALFYSVAVPVN